MRQDDYFGKAGADYFIQFGLQRFFGRMAHSQDNLFIGIIGFSPDIVFYTFMSAAIIRAAAQAHIQGLVIAGLGHGKIPANILSELHRIRQDNGIAVVRTSRTGNGIVSPSREERNHGFVAGDNLSCQKAKILLQLALIQTQDPAEIQDIFDQY